MARHFEVLSSFGLKLRCECAGISGISPYQFELRQAAVVGSAQEYLSSGSIRQIRRMDADEQDEASVGAADIPPGDRAKCPIVSTSR